jgi:hypothetical protein
MDIKRGLTGAAAVAGGALWIAFAALAAGLPEGCVGDGCLLRSHRDVGELELLFLAGGVLILLSFAGLARRLPKAAPVALAGGVALIVAGTTSEDLWTPLVVPGMLACVAGYTLAGASLTPRWLGWLVVAGSLGLLAANDQDARVLMLIPFSAAWMCVGLAQWSESAARIRFTTAVRSRSAS